MGKPIVYGTLLSPPVRCVLLTAKAIGLEVDYKDVKLFEREHMSEEYLKMNPQHTVPTLDDNGAIVWDSHAISTYLIGKYGKNDSLYPKDLLIRAKIDQRLHFDSGVLFPAIKEIAVTLLRRKETELSQKAIDATADAYSFMEQFLVNDSYLVGNSLTVADLSCLSTVTTLNLFIPIDTTKYPKLAQWVERLSKLPYYETNQAGLDVFDEFIKTSAPQWKR